LPVSILQLTPSPRRPCARSVIERSVRHLTTT
jgi:hypothetical protein